jgi:energy-coupling factor transport system ATP-binding protein
LLSSHPYDLSGGEQQRAALAKTLLLRPRILLLDEPTKGFDAEFKAVFADILRKLAEGGAAVIAVSHDVEFCAEYADRCALFFDGSIVTEGTPRAFFSGNSFYTSAANRMARHRFPLAITTNDVIEALGAQVPVDETKISEGEDHDVHVDISDEDVPPRLKDKGVFASLSPVRKAAAGISALCLMVAVAFIALKFDGFRDFISGGDIAAATASDAVWKYAGIMALSALSAAALVFSLSRKRGEQKPARARTLSDRKTLPKRTIMAMLMILIVVPLTVFVGIFFLEDRKYYFISVLIIIETMLPFAFIFEGRKPQAREIVVIAVMCALAAASRMAFFMLPQFKPAAALVIVSGVAFGGEAGFLIGAMTAFVSNMFFGQGPWTPWQMFALGLIGFLAGALFRKGLLHRGRASLAVFGALATFLIYGGIMNAAAVLMFQSSPTKGMFVAAYLQGIPFDLIHAFSTVIFLLLISRPMLEKLDRIKVKYGIAEPG